MLYEASRLKTQDKIIYLTFSTGIGGGIFKNNYLSKGYEIADMLNKPYNEGMRINADFVLDENLEPDTRIITSITNCCLIGSREGNSLRRCKIKA